MCEPDFVIEETFFIKGRGLVLAFSPETLASTARVKIGDLVDLTCLDGGTLRTRVNGVELINVDIRVRPHPPLGILVSLSPEDAIRLRGTKAQVVTEKANS